MLTLQRLEGHRPVLLHPPVSGDDLQHQRHSRRTGSRSSVAWFLRPLYTGASRPVPVQMSEVRQYGTTFPLRWLTAQRPCGSGRLLRLRLERIRERLRLVQARRSHTGANGSRQIPAQQIQSATPRENENDHQGTLGLASKVNERGPFPRHLVNGPHIRKNPIH